MEKCVDEEYSFRSESGLIGCYLRHDNDEGNRENMKICSLCGNLINGVSHPSCTGCNSLKLTLDMGIFFDLTLSQKITKLFPNM